MNEKWEQTIQQNRGQDILKRTPWIENCGGISEVKVNENENTLCVQKMLMTSRY